MGEAGSIAIVALVADLAIRIGLSLRIIMRRIPVGVSLAWLTIVLIVPLFGAVLYLLLGEMRLGGRRARRAETIHEPYIEWLENLHGRHPDVHSIVGGDFEPLARLADTVTGIPPLPGNALQLFHDSATAFRAMISDIDGAKRTCHLEFYIWSCGGAADEVAEALRRAASRGVICRMLVDAVGSNAFLRSRWVSRLRGDGVDVRAALPVGLLRMLFFRLDLRNHRKIVVIDGEVAYTGSLNLADPAYFKLTAGVGQWVDAMARLRGPGVEALAITFLEDWQLETGHSLENLVKMSDVHALPRQGQSTVQVVPSGPMVRPEVARDVLLMALYSARRELILTTPYFVPDEAMLTALKSAAGRGVAVTLILPAKVDSRLVRYASRAQLDNLLAAGVRVEFFGAGLLHTKSITIDQECSLFGSLNLDLRSLKLDFEITLVVYDKEFTSRLRQLQFAYIEQSRTIDLYTWRQRPFRHRLTDNVARLLSPLL